MKLGIDGFFMCGKRTGMGVMLENILFRWNGKLFEKTILYIPNALEKEKEELLRQNSIEIQVLKKRNFILWEQYIVPREAKKNGLDTLWFPFNTGSLVWRKECIVTIHDTIYMHGCVLKQPTLYKAAGQLYRRIIVPRIARKANRIITTTSEVAKELIDCFRIKKDKISMVSCCFSTCEQNMNDNNWNEFRNKNEINQPFFLAYGSIDSRKNTARILQAFKKIATQNQEIDLVLFGLTNNKKHNKIRKAINRHSLSNRVHLLGYISELEKKILYSKAIAFVFPSTCEGFGIPILEAFNNGTAVITSNVSSMPLIAGNAALLVDPYSIDMIANAMLAVSDVDCNMELVARGQKEVKKYSWSKTAELCAKAIAYIDNSAYAANYGDK